MNARSRFLAYVPALLWAALILFLGSRSFATVDLPDFALPTDKLLHFVLYGMLGVLAAWGWRRAGQWPAIMWPLALALLIGVVDELQQRGVPARGAELADWLVDAGAIVLAFIVLGRRPYPAIRTE